MKWDWEVQTYLMLSIFNIRFVILQLPFAIPSLRMDGTSPFKAIGDLHVWANSSIKNKPYEHRTVQILMQDELDSGFAELQQLTSPTNPLQAILANWSSSTSFFFLVLCHRHNVWLLINSDVCVAKLRGWHKKGVNISLLESNNSPSSYG